MALSKDAALDFSRKHQPLPADDKVTPTCTDGGPRPTPTEQSTRRVCGPDLLAAPKIEAGELPMRSVPFSPAAFAHQ